MHTCVPTRDIMHNKCEMRMTDPMLNILARAREHVIKDDDIVPLLIRVCVCV